MFRGLRHTLFLLLQLGIVMSAAIAWAVQPEAWRAIAICTAGGTIVVYICERLARHWLRATVGRLRHLAEDIGRGRPAATLPAHPGDDLYKLVNAFNILAERLEQLTEEEKRLQEQLRRSERLAFLGELAATVAHEINNPLDGVQSCARILRRSQNDPERAAQMLDLIDSGLVRMHLIVRRLLTLAREHVIRPVATSLTTVLDSALAAVQDRLTARDARLIRSYNATDDRVSADPQLLEQVFVNLLLNAVDSLEQGGDVEITVEREPAAPPSRTAEQNADTLRVDIRDTGTGIASDVLPRIFEPFFTTKTGGKGTGLGLPIAARIADAHHGRVEVSSEEGQGSVFTVRLPAIGGGRGLTRTETATQAQTGAAVVESHE